MSLEKPTTVRATAYLTISAKRRRYDDAVTSARIINSTQGKPHTLTGNQIAVKVTVELPAAAFDPLEPSALIVVPEELIQHAVNVEAGA